MSSIENDDALLCYILKNQHNESAQMNSSWPLWTILSTLIVNSLIYFTIKITHTLKVNSQNATLSQSNRTHRTPPNTYLPPWVVQRLPPLRDTWWSGWSLWGFRPVSQFMIDSKPRWPFNDQPIVRFENMVATFFLEFTTNFTPSNIPSRDKIKNVDKLTTHHPI